MGASTFVSYKEGIDATKAFLAARDEAAFEYGHGGYTGTIAEKSGFRVLSQTPMSRRDAEAFAEREMQNPSSVAYDKWGDAGAVPIAASGKEVTRTLRITVTVLGDPMAQEGAHYWSERNAVTAAIAAKVRLKAGESITGIFGPELGAQRGTNGPHDPKRTYKVTSSATAGKAVTRYIITGSNNRSLGHDTWETGFPTQAEARAFALEMARSETIRGGSLTYSISSVTRRENGDPLAIITRTLVKTVWTADVDVTFTPPLKSGAPIVGWLFFGWASD